MPRRKRRDPKGAPEDLAGVNLEEDNGRLAPRERSVTVDGDNLGIISTGDNAINLQPVLPADALRPVTDVVAAPGLANLPFCAETFVGRTDELRRLDDEFHNSGLGRVVVEAVHGLGGIGKSALAAHWGAANAANFNPIWWVTAETPATITSGLANLAVALQPELTQALPLEALAERATQWLTAHDHWLLILDNAVNPADIEPLIARIGTGSFLITSRLATGWHHVTDSVVRLGVLSMQEALQLLRRIATIGQRSADLEGAGDLCDELGYLPLAIEQAGAFIAEASISRQEYLGLLAQYPAEIYDQAAEGGDSTRTIARIWRVTLDRLASTPLGEFILKILAWYAPTDIPKNLLDPMNDFYGLVTCQHAIGRLAAYNMITINPGETFTIHRLVQAVTRTADPNDPHRQPELIDAARFTATHLLRIALPESSHDPGEWANWRRLVSHIDALASYAAPDTDDVTASELFGSASLFLRDQGALSSAITYLRRSLVNLERQRGNDDSSTMAARNNLAGAYKEAGDLPQAISLYRQALSDSERVFGPDNPNTLMFRNNLATAYQAADDLQTAIGQFERCLADSTRVHGPDHHSTLLARSNLAMAYYDADDVGRAIPLLEETLTETMRVLGPEHPETMSAPGNLATAYLKANDPARAIPLLERTLADRQRVLGSDHPTTLHARNNLAGARLSIGDFDQAVPLLEQLVSDTERLLNTAEHPETLKYKTNLAQAYMAVGDLDHAISLFAEIVTERERIFGVHHTSAQTARDNLVHAYVEAGSLSKAIVLLEGALTDAQRTLGADHLTTLKYRTEVSGAYQKAHDYAHSVLLLEKNLAYYKQLFGSDHPDTRKSRSYLAAAYLGAGHWNNAIELINEIYRDSMANLGRYDPKTLEALDLLASAYRRIGDLDSAISAYEQSLHDKEHGFGPDHPEHPCDLRCTCLRTSRRR